jgi:hypothetical protein
MMIQVEDAYSRTDSYRRQERYAWVKLLWRKVIVRAIYDYVLWKDIPRTRKRHDAQDAARWLFETSDLNNSLECVCLIADVDPEKIRAYARIATKAEVKKLEHIERDRARCLPPCLALPEEEDEDGEDQ